jgi:hypothetical protein
MASMPIITKKKVKKETGLRARLLVFTALSLWDR